MAKTEKALSSITIQKKLNLVGDGSSTTQTVQSTHTSELVIALCGPIGSPLHRVAETIRQVLTSDFGYQRCEVIKLSKIIEQHSADATISRDAFKRVKELISLGDELRKKHGSGVLTELAISKIVIDREKSKEENGQVTAHPRRVCHIIDSIKKPRRVGCT